MTAAVVSTVPVGSAAPSNVCFHCGTAGALVISLEAIREDLRVFNSLLKASKLLKSFLVTYKMIISAAESSSLLARNLTGLRGEQIETNRFASSTFALKAGLEFCPL